MRYDKLVRDTIPEIITKKGKTAVTHIADEREYWDKLQEKLEEEVKEFLFAKNEEEMGDILEVLDAIMQFKGFDKQNIDMLQKKKAAERGKFTKRIILEEVKQ
jgi:predicted house-cleaning noncanonical NTP pyrophosphatase (MazG superfamily)